MKKATNKGGSGCNAYPTLVPCSPHRTRARAELQFIYAGLTHSQAEVAATHLLQGSLTAVLDMDSRESNVQSQRRYAATTKFVSLFRSEPQVSRSGETENGSAHSAEMTGALDNGGAQ